MSGEHEKRLAILVVHLSHMKDIRPKEFWMRDINKQKRLRRGETYFKINL
jgi:hypothetical protein